MSGFRDFATARPQADPAHVKLLAEAKLMMEDPWEEEFLTSIGRSLDQGWTLSAKQVNLLSRIASGAVAEERSRQQEALDNGDAEPLPSEAAAGMDDVHQRYEDIRDANIRGLKRDMYDHDRGW